MAPQKVRVNIISEFQEICQSPTTTPRKDLETPIDHLIVARAGQIVPPKRLRAQHLWHLQKRKNGGPLLPVNPQEDHICFTNMAGMTLWKQVDVFLNGEMVTKNNHSHATTVDLRVEVEFTQHEKKFDLADAGYHPDVGSEEMVTDARKESLFSNDGLIEFTTPLLVDCLWHDIPFPDDVDILIRLHRSKLEWCINGVPADGTTYELTLIRANLLVTRLVLAPGSDLYRSFGGTINYPFLRYETRHFILPGNITSINQEIHRGVLPSKIYILFIDQDGYHGSYAHNPLQYEHYWIKWFCLKRDDLITIPPNPYTFDYEVKQVPPPPPVSPTAGRAKRVRRALATAADDVEGSSGSGSGSGKKVASLDADDPMYLPKDAEEAYKLAREKEIADMQANPPKPKLVNFVRAFNAMKEERGNHVNTCMTREQWINGRFIQVFDLRSDRYLEPGESMVQPTASLRYQSEHHREISRPIVMLVYSEYETVLSLRKGGIVA
jgi:hypothetical protein